MLLSYYVFIILILTDIAATIKSEELCVIADPVYNTDRHIPTQLFKAYKGIIYEYTQESNGATEYCYHYLSYTYPNGTYCSPDKFNWDGADIGLYGVKYFHETFNLKDINSTIKFIYVPIPEKEKDFDFSHPVTLPVDSSRFTINYMYRTMYLKDFGRYVSAFVTREKTGALVVGARTGYHIGLFWTKPSIFFKKRKLYFLVMNN